MTFNSEEELQKIRATIRLRQPYKFRPSPIDTWKGEILSLRKSGASLAELREFLRGKKISVHGSTISRWLKKHG